MPSFILRCTFVNGEPTAAYGVVGDKSVLEALAGRMTQDPDSGLDTYEILPVQPLPEPRVPDPLNNANAHVSQTEGKRKSKK